MLVHQSRCCPRNRRHKNNRAIPPTLTEADLFGPFDQVIHLLALSVCTDCDNALVVSAQAEKERQKDNVLDKMAMVSILYFTLYLR